MKTKIIIAFLLVLFLAFTGLSQLQLVKTSTYYGIPDTGAVGGNKINTNFLYLENMITNFISTNTFISSSNTAAVSFTNNANVFSGTIVSGNAQSLTNLVLSGPTNGTLPASTIVIKAWANFTNSSGGVFKIPLYQ